jgi:hypothetical protein
LKFGEGRWTTKEKGTYRDIWKKDFTVEDLRAVCTRAQLAATKKDKTPIMKKTTLINLLLTAKVIPPIVSK